MIQTRYFVKFRNNTSLHNKVMVFNDLTRQEVWDTVMQMYPLAVDKILSEQELARLLPNIYEQSHLWVQLFTKVTVYKLDCNNRVTSDIEIVYPLEPNNTDVSVDSITEWFRVAKPEPKEKDKSTQLGVVFEEVAELLEVFMSKDENTDLQNEFTEAYTAISRLSNRLYKVDKLPDLNHEERVQVLDALADITVTTTGSAYMLGMQMDKALSEVNRSNFSKYENGKPVFNEHGKMIKGKGYTKPNLEEYV